MKYLIIYDNEKVLSIAPCFGSELATLKKVFRGTKEEIELYFEPLQIEKGILQEWLSSFKVLR